MRNRRKNWLFRRVVVGLAVAAIVAPTAQARLYEGGAAQSTGNDSVIQGDDKVLAPETGLIVKGDDKVLAPETGLIVKGDDKVFAPESDSAIVKGDDKVILTPADWQYNQHGYVQGTYHGDVATQVRDTEPTVGKPAGRQVPIAATGTQSDFGWSDGLMVAAAALGLALLAFGAVRSTREMRRPAPSV